MNSTRTLSAALALTAAVTLIAGAVAPASAVPNDPPAAKAQAAKLSPKEDKRLYCVQGKFTGSNMVKRVCHTRSEWIDRTGIDPAKDR